MPTIYTFNRSAKKVVGSVLFSLNLNKKRNVPKLSFPTFAHKTSLRTFQATYFQRKTRNKFKVKLYNFPYSDVSKYSF